jgi:branched-chain amino acid transport system substrate-binding protein
MGRRLEGGDGGRSCGRSDAQSGTRHVSCLREISILCLVFGFVALGLPGRSTAAEVYPLGIALGFSGTGAPYSEEALKGIQLAVDEINAEGGFLGKHLIKLFVANTKTRPEVAETVVRRLIHDDRVRAVIGTYSSATALAIKPICRNVRVLHIATISNSEDITKLDPSPYTFSVVPNTYMMSKAIAVGTAKLAKERSWRTYMTIASDYAWGRSSQQIQVMQLKQLAPDLKLVEALWPPLGDTALNSQVVAIRNRKPDFVLESIAGADKAMWDVAVRGYRLLDTIAMPFSLISVTELIRESNLIRRGVYGRARAPFFAHMDNPMMAKLVAAYVARYGLYPTDWAVMAYDGVYALNQAIEKAGSIDTDRVKDAMTGLTIDTTRGRLYFREIDNQLSVSAYLGRVADDPRYDFPIYADLVELKGPDIWRPEAEILAARGK